MTTESTAGVLRVAHCSDIHLAGDHHGADYYKDGFIAVLAAARARQPGLLMLAGDLFDSNTADDGTIAWAMDVLDSQPYPVVMIPGNHDCLEAGAIYHRFDFDALPNVHMLSAPAGEVRCLEGLDVAVWGKGMVDHCADYEPVLGAPPRPEGVQWYLGLGHGIYVPHGAETGRSSPIHARDIASSPCDYLALGHHHAALEVHDGDTAAAYCGSPTDTIGAGPTYAVVDLFPHRRPAVQISLVE